MSKPHDNFITMENAEYHAHDALGSSDVRKLMVSPLHLKGKEEPAVRPSYFTFGSAVHSAYLEPDKFATEYRAKPAEVDGQGPRTKAYKEFAAGVDGPIISSDDVSAYWGQRQQVINHPEVVKLGLFKEGEPESEIYWDEDGKPCKCKVDWLGPDYWVEYKTTASLNGFDRTAAGMNYHLQLGWYHRGVATLGKPRKCYVVAQEQKAPYDVAVMEVSSMNCKRWFGKCMEIYDKWLSGDRSGAFPEAFQFELPPYMDEAAALDVGVQMDAMFKEVG